MIYTLVGLEQCGFILGRSAFDNVIDAQEVSHRLENDSSTPPMMITKIDIEQAFDTIDWNVILAILHKMMFPECWICWIKACLSYASFSFLVNGK